MTVAGKNACVLIISALEDLAQNEKPEILIPYNLWNVAAIYQLNPIAKEYG